MSRVTRTALMVAVGLAPLALAAQALPSVALRGVAYDSVASRPLGGAFVTLDGVRTAFADDAGAFTFDGVTPGSYLLEMTHPVLDSMGLPGVAARVRVGEGLAPITIAVPSFATLWRAACGDRPVPRDSGFVYGTVRSATDGAAAPRTDVELSWSDLRVENIRLITGRRFRAETESDANGEYSVCGVPLDEGMRLQARRAGLASAMLDVIPANLRVIRRDLLLAPSDTAATTARGTITGSVTHGAGGPFEGATIVLDDTPQARTGADGRFTLANVVVGTHQVEVLGIGARPQLFVVDVLAGAQATVSAVLERVTTLDVVRVIGSPWQVRMLEGIEARRQSGFARMLDSTAIGRQGSIGTAFAGLNGVQVRLGRSATDFAITMRNGDGDPCTPRVRIDGMPSDTDMLKELHPSDIAVAEVYARAASVPIDLQGGVTSCGLIVIWTKRIVP